jgi:hypothetical protein
MMRKQLRSAAVYVALGVTPALLCPVVMHAQQVSEDQRAYQAGYQNGVNAARNNRPMNNNTDDWHGDRLNMYQQGYQAGYNSVRGGVGEFAKDPERQRAYQAGYENGANAAEHNRPMNANSGDWHGDRLQAYQEGYERGYRSVRGEHHD